MLRLTNDLWTDQAGFVVSAEMVLISTVGVIGIGTGLVCVRDAVNSELTDVACAITSLDQSYCYTGFHSYKDRCRCVTKAQTAGSSYPPRPDAEPCDIELRRDPAGEELLYPIPEYDPRPHFIERDGERDTPRDGEEPIMQDRVIRKPLRTKDSDSEDSNTPALPPPQPPLMLPRLTPEHDPTPDRPSDR